jgi:hypothetical protein
MKPPLFHVGQAIVCTVGAPIGWQPPYGEATPQKGSVYHVREVVQGGPTDWGVTLKEIVNMPNSYKQGRHECAFPEKWFAPVEEMPAEAYAELLEALEPVTA